MAKQKTVHLSRMFTYNGQHHGPGEASLDEEHADQLQRRDQEIMAKEQAEIDARAGKVHTGIPIGNQVHGQAQSPASLRPLPETKAAGTEDSGAASFMTEKDSTESDSK